MRDARVHRRPGPIGVEILAFLLEAPASEEQVRARWPRVGWVWLNRSITELVVAGLVRKDEARSVYVCTSEGLRAWMHRPPMPRT